MRKSWLKIKTEFLSYSRGDRVGIIVLSVLIVALIGVRSLLNTKSPDPVLTQQQFKEIQQQWNFALQANESTLTKSLSRFNFNPNTIDESALDSLDLPEQIKRNMIKYRAAGGSFSAKNDVRKLYGMNDSIFQQIEAFIVLPIKNENVKLKNVEKAELEKPSGFFDPNNAGVTELQRFGFSSYQANNIVSYLNSGGSYQKPEDLLKIYGLDSATYNQIVPYIKIKVVAEPEKETSEELFTIELNSADTIDLLRLKGIGPVYAGRIIKYRNLLGGFHNSSQLLEVYGFSEEMFSAVQSLVTVDSTTIEPIRINYAEFAELLRHPYFDKSSVSVILNEKDRNGPIKNLAELEKLEFIDAEFIDKVRPYVTCR
ncbi:helix-hairpin-helix domain-containing protein [uncultured Draconibacterium sp.]|uniref:helix-hairpin-helix domain-containing protein n=1 Tax=uncultured Draconibacterium sp. TaxID=1573823 RepID=UPI002AA8EF33|nr:helix-hairpin-helix domain-containing protein [uncultured Draconibacterium sp.]